MVHNAFNVGYKTMEVGSIMAKNFNLAISLLKKIRIIESLESQNKLLAEIDKCQGAIVVAFLNAHGINLVVKSQCVGKAFLNADIILRDGKGLEMLYKSAGFEPGFNMNGTDFLPVVLESFRSKTIAIYGTKEPWLTRAKEKLLQQGHKIVDTYDGFQDSSFYLERIRSTQPEFILLAMGMPKLEEIASLIKNNHNNKCIVICGGAIVDFLAGRFTRAPKCMRRLGIEWLYRLVNEPKRLFRRYVIGNLTFLINMNKLVSGIKS